MKFKLGTKVVSAVKNAKGKVDLVVEPASGGPQEKVFLAVDITNLRWN
jgi:dihydrolipoamide dehydrogenase